MVVQNNKRRETVLPPKKNPLLRGDSDVTSGSNEKIIKQLKNSDQGSMQSVEKRLSREHVNQLQMLLALREPQNPIGNNRLSKNEKKSDVSMVDRNSLFSKSSQLSKEMLVSQLLKMNKNFDSRSNKDMQQQLSDEYKSLRSNERMSNGVVSQLLRSLNNRNSDNPNNNNKNAFSRSGGVEGMTRA